MSILYYSNTSNTLCHWTAQCRVCEHKHHRILNTEVLEKTLIYSMSYGIILTFEHNGQTYRIDRLKAKLLILQKCTTLRVSFVFTSVFLNCFIALFLCFILNWFWYFSFQPIKNPPTGKKYVRCPCNCLLICKDTSRRIGCPRPNW